MDKARLKALRAKYRGQRQPEPPVLHHHPAISYLPGDRSCAYTLSIGGDPGVLVARAVGCSICSRVVHGLS